MMFLDVIKKKVLELAMANWMFRLVLFLALRPKRCLSEFWYPMHDFRKFKESVAGYRQFLAGKKPRVDVADAEKKPGLLIVAGVMSAQWCQIWSILAGAYKDSGYRTFVLTSKGQPIQNWYFDLFGVEKIYVEDLKFDSVRLPDALTGQIAQLDTFDAFKQFEHEGCPIGKMALSTYSRMRTTGIMDVDDPQSVNEVRSWATYICKVLIAAGRLYEKYQITQLFITELFMDYYGGLYYQALKQDLNIIRFAGTVRDNAIVVAHQNRKNDRTHFSSITPESWADIISRPFHGGVEQELTGNFEDRYGDRWALSKRNQPNTVVSPPEEVRAELGIAPERKVAIIYSHILYDTLFFNGEYLFRNYAEWLVESIRAACKNPNVDWFIKVHPSNLWRGELENSLDGLYEEVRLIREFIGELPDHVKLIYPDTPYSPYTWLQVADYGVTVTGTSGIELGALGKAVVTAGTGRYENIGFTINSDIKEDYLNVLGSIESYPMPSPEQTELAKRFAYATFCMKPYTLDFLTPVAKSGIPEIKASEDLVYLAEFEAEDGGYPQSMLRFLEWSGDGDKIDFLNPWPEAPSK